MKSPLGRTGWRLSLAAVTLCAVLYSSCGLLNEAPVISSLQSQKEWVDLSGNSEIECIAADPDGDELTYEWGATDGDISGEGFTVTWMAPDTSGTYTIAVKVTDGKGGEATRELTIDVLVNRPPVIESLTAERLVANLAESIVIECVASDADQDLLAYAWSATGGTFSGKGPITAWMAPDTSGTYTITVMVIDGRGGEVTEELTIDVMVNHSPIIERLTAERRVVKQGESIRIECVASDPDGDKLTYLWSATEGAISVVGPDGATSGEGSTVDWIAPDTCAEYVVTVTVVDDRGGETSEELSLTVQERPG